MMIILTINAGSSSVRLAAFSHESGRLKKHAASHHEPSEPGELLGTFLRDNGITDVFAISHRIVHGGERLVDSCPIDDKVEREIDRLSKLAPLHNPVALGWVRECRQALGPKVQQVAVFDTAFYAGMPEATKIYALPRDLQSKHGIRRYGFHGLAHRAMWERLAAIRLDIESGGTGISLQLGAGCSITAVRDGGAVDTSMGFSPLEGLVMATRSGDIDPRVVTYLQHTVGMSIEEVETLLNHSSGLLGVSGLSADMRALLDSESPDARLAVELYCYRARKYIGAYMATLSGADVILFGGGVGENAPSVRERILSGMEWCGVELDNAANDRAIGEESRISSPGSRVDVWVVPVDEAELMAREAITVLEGNKQ